MSSHIPASRSAARRRLPTLAYMVGLTSTALIATTADAQQWRPPDDARSVIDTTFRFQRDGLVDAEQLAGEVIVSSWDRPEVRVRAWTEYGRLIHSFSDTRVRLRVEGERDRRMGRNTGDSYYEIMVPVGTRVRARSVSGEVTVTGTNAEVDAQSVSGDVKVSQTTGLTTASSVSGDVNVDRVSGDLTVKSVSGDVTANDVEGDVRATSVSGELLLSALRSRIISAKTTSGGIEFAGTLRPDGRYEFTSHSGDVTLSLPADLGAELSVRTFSGELDSSFPITLGGRGRDGGNSRSMEFTVGGGGARITVETFSGDVELRGPEGRSRR